MIENLFNATLGKQWKKWSFQAGARLEQYNVEAIFKQASAADGQFKDDILSIYPSTFLSYNQVKIILTLAFQEE
jgi:hypothetical protein